MSVIGLHFERKRKPWHPSMVPTKLPTVNSHNIAKISCVRTREALSDSIVQKAGFNVCFSPMPHREWGLHIAVLCLDSTEHTSKQNTPVYYLAPPLLMLIIVCFLWHMLLLMPKMMRIGDGSSNCSVLSFRVIHRHILSLASSRFFLTDRRVFSKPSIVYSQAVHT